MARSFILGGVAGTSLATGKPYFKRIIREGGAAAGPTRADGLTCKVIASGDNQGALSFATTASAAGTATTDGKGTDWGAAVGELLFVEFPSTTRTLSVQFEEMHCATSNHEVRARIMLVAEGQRVNASSSGTAVYATPVTNNNFIEISEGDTATINARTKGVFIQIFNVNLEGAGSGAQASGSVLDNAGNYTIIPGTGTGSANDAAVFLVTAVLDQDNRSAASVDFSTATIGTAGTVNGAKLTKIWGNIDGVG